jgi:nuclear pore complex protein Nup205
MRLLPTPNTDTFKDEAGRRLLSALTRISSLDLVSLYLYMPHDPISQIDEQNAETIGPEWQSYQGYLEIMSRRLRDTVGLHDEA